MISIGFVGDIMPGGVLVYEGKISSEIKEIFQKFDLRVANLESALCDGITKCHIKMSDPKLGNIIYTPPREGIKILKSLNINVVSLANNHICDCDLDGLAKTIDVLDQNGIAHFGAGRNRAEAEKPAIINIKGQTICFLGYFPPMWEAPYPPTDFTGGLNHFYIDKVIRDVKKYKQLYDYVFVMPHWGKEHTRLPYTYDVRFAKQIIDAGATGVIGSHTHTVQPVIKYNGKLVAMSLGNFIFPDRWIVPPRITCYPNEQERMAKNHPVVYGFPIVKELTYKKVDDKNREGVVLSVFLDNSSIRFKLKYTTLDNQHILRLKRLKKGEVIKLKAISVLIFDKWTLSYRIFCKILNIKNRILNKISRCI